MDKRIEIWNVLHDGEITALSRTALWQLWQRLPGPAGVRAWEVYVTGTGATRGVPAAGGR
jgi:hypothetical protein